MSKLDGCVFFETDPQPPGAVLLDNLQAGWLIYVLDVPGDGNCGFR